VELAESLNFERARVYRTLAKLFQPPSPSAVAELRARELPELRSALIHLGCEENLLEVQELLSKRMGETEARELERSYEQTFEPSGGLQCPPHETAHTVEKAQEAMLRTFQLADIAGFYRAFAVEIVPGTERVDHIAAELEFMHLLAVKEAVAEADGRPEQAGICRDAARAFLSEHLARWTSCFAARLEAVDTDPAYAAAGCLLDRFVERDVAQMGAS
jgi:DMSO reductase family type II enzyme chaperone